MLRRELGPPKAVVFDLGGVLIDWNPRYLYRKLFNGDDGAMEDFLRDVCNSSWNERQDEGRSWADAIASLVAAYPEKEALIRAYRERWAEMLAGPIEGTVSILRRLREREVPLYAITNWSAETFPLARERFEFLAWFRDIVVSGDEKTLKPGPRIFQALFDRNGLSASDCLFIDDVPANVDGARSAGMRAIHFRSPEALDAELRGLGLLEG
jgi:2-haloacid dehalogenase